MRHRRVDVLLGLSFRMVVAVVGDPPKRPALHRQTAHQRQYELHHAVGLKRTMGQQAVKACRHADAAEYVHKNCGRKRSSTDAGVKSRKTSKMEYGHANGHGEHLGSRAWSATGCFSHTSESIPRSSF